MGKLFRLLTLEILFMWAVHEYGMNVLFPDGII